LRFLTYLIILSAAIIFFMRVLLKLINTNLKKISYKLTKQFACYFAYIIIILLAIIIGKKFLYNIF